MAKKKYIVPKERVWDLFINGYVPYEIEQTHSKIQYVGKNGDRKADKHYPVITMEGFKLWLSQEGIIEDFSDYVKNKDNRYAEYAPIITRVKEYIFVHNLRGAATGDLKENLIARYLNLKEQVEQNSTHNVKILSIDPIADAESDNFPEEDSSPKEKD